MEGNRSPATHARVKEASVSFPIPKPSRFTYDTCHGLKQAKPTVYLVPADRRATTIIRSQYSSGSVSARVEKTTHRAYILSDTMESSNYILGWERRADGTMSPIFLQIEVKEACVSLKKHFTTATT